jgi:Transposase IS66 family
MTVTLGTDMSLTPQATAQWADQRIKREGSPRRTKGSNFSPSSEESGANLTIDRLATITGRVWAYVRDDRPFARPDPPAAAFFYSRNRDGEHPNQHLAGYAGILQADAYAGFADLFNFRRRRMPSTPALFEAERDRRARSASLECASGSHTRRWWCQQR